ncbi:Nucleoside 2-deoxyribosyltransferase [Candidatus Terasakiella magnetica]|uniref:Nucleoside 2-deoxyribosyltransferase n=1 Tax=Candidatus Terasakiella magnetica TaxID=1867952 RepID=A0A1C3REY0_9PROT|nr:nucleoside 2-deoxyribosyltransferase [Candidatus Terasakiella magnetica]SCA55846.1 Nucleoside 2-deoxyribosyltransferase [Candidatus Terasakiella magnetica]
MAPRIYLAGPDVFYKDPMAQCAELKALCAANGCEGVFPMDAGLDIASMSKHEAARAIYQANIEMIDSCDGIIANMEMFRGPGMDGGTAFEMGYGVAKAIPVVGYGITENYLKRCQAYYGELEPSHGLQFDPKGLMVEDFDLLDNLMMACGAQAIVETAEEAVKYLSRLCVTD